MVIEHHLKWAPLCVSEPGPLPDAAPSERFGRYDFHHADAILDWCERHNISKIKGHVLVWHVTSPKFLQDLEPHQVREQLRRHIYTVMGHFRGRITTWDVCNECLAPDGSLAENVFYRKLGPGYIEDCFRWAHEADPDAVLLYNDNKVEGIGTPKSDGLYNLLGRLEGQERARARLRPAGPLERGRHGREPAADAAAGQTADSPARQSGLDRQHFRTGRAGQQVGYGRSRFTPNRPAANLPRHFGGRTVGTGV